MKEREVKSGGVGCFVIGVIGVIVPVLYLLGLGPASYIADHYPATYDVIVAIYQPLGFAGKHCPPLRAALDWYLSLWGY